MKSKEEILDSHHKENTKHIRSISPEQFPVAYRKTALDSMEEYAAQFKDSPYQGSAGDQWQDEHLAEVTEIMRDADMRFAGIGGGTRHYLRDLLFPMLQEKGLSICRAAVPAGDGEAIEILKELCRLKSHKDNVGKDSVYEQRQPEAWKRANEFLNRLITPPNKSV